MIEAAEAHAAAQSCDTAKKLLERAEVEIERRAQSGNRERTRQEIEWLRDQLKKAQQSISATKKGVGEPSDAAASP
jgi:5-bromo-4-chloroindolyl phosphate hydrolysis protein